MTARHRGWFQYEYGATNLAVHFLSSMIIDGLMDSVNHETDPFNVSEAGAGGVGYPAVVVHAVLPSGFEGDASQRYALGQGQTLVDDHMMGVGACELEKGDVVEIRLPWCHSCIQIERLDEKKD